MTEPIIATNTVIVERPPQRSPGATSSSFDLVLAVTARALRLHGEHVMADHLERAWAAELLRRRNDER